MLRRLLEAAWERRSSLHDDPGTDTYRVLHGHGEGRPGIAVDRYGAVFVLRRGEVEDEQPAAAEADRDAVGAHLAAAGIPQARVLLDRGPRASRGQPARKAPSVGAVRVREGGLRYEVTPARGANPGLYLDARPARAWVRSHAEGRRMLNLFAWTGSFGVAALAGDARSVVHVDQQKRGLARARANHALNDQRIDDRDLVRDDVYRVLRKAATRGQRFGAVVIDAPPVVPRRGARGQDLARLVPRARAVLADDGWILCTFNRRHVTTVDYEAGILEACPDLRVIARGTSGIDFPEADPERKLRFAVFAPV